jgi:hypothetical protein
MRMLTVVTAAMVLSLVEISQPSAQQYYATCKELVDKNGVRIIDGFPFGRTVGSLFYRHEYIEPIRRNGRIIWITRWRPSRVIYLGRQFITQGIWQGVCAHVSDYEDILPDGEGHWDGWTEDRQLSANTFRCRLPYAKPTR